MRNNKVKKLPLVKNIPKLLHPDCKECISNAREKYSNYITTIGEHYEDGFGVDCPFIPPDELFVDSRLRSKLSEQDFELVNSYRSALLWGEKNLIDPNSGRPWKAWPYQRGPLLCKSPRKVYRFGRRCLPVGTPILMANGFWKSIETVIPGEVVVSSEPSGKLTTKKVLNFFDNGYKEVYRITLSNGASIDCTSNHPLLTQVYKSVAEWRSIEDGLEEGMKVRILDHYNCWGTKQISDLDSFDFSKKFSDEVFFLNKESIISILRKLFSSSNSICSEESGVKLFSDSRKMLDQVRLLLLKLGIIGNISREFTDGIFQFKLSITSYKSLYNFYRIIKDDSIPDLIFTEDYNFVSISTIIAIGFQPTYDIEVEDTHNFVSNGIFTHNTGKSTILAIEILWYLFTSAGGTIKDEVTGKIRKNLKVLLLTPQKTHVEGIFGRIRDFVSVSPNLENCIGRNKRGSPQIISLVSNDGIGEGNTVTGFASGDSSGSRGLTARGQDADLIVLDEGAFISAEAIKGVVLAILYTHPNTKFIVSSTPSGIAGDYFEDICIRRPDFAEFYVPATKRPDWSRVEDQIRREFGNTQENYDKEVLAAFSPAGIGVYREDLVRFAKEDYYYGDYQYSRAFVYTFGIDWNKEHGTEIAIIATKRSPPHISYVVHSENIPKKSHTSPLGVSRIVELNRIWQPAWIYVDAGGGDGGVILRHHGQLMVKKHMVDARLKDIVKDFNFGSSLSIVEHDGSIKKVPAKPFMVDNSVKKFELGEIKFPKDDINLAKQFNNYIVARRTPAGIPVYDSKDKKVGDHVLDSVNLALVAVRLEFSSFYNDSTPKIDPINFVRPSIPNEQKTRIILPSNVGIAGTSSRKIPSNKSKFHSGVNRSRSSTNSIWVNAPGKSNRKLFGR
jgi:hypothetical protein